MKKFKIFSIVLFLLLIASVFNTSHSYAAQIQDAITKAKRENKMLFLVCAVPNSKKAKKIHSMVKSKQIRLSKKIFTYEMLTIGTPEQKEELMNNFTVTEQDKGPFVCISDQNGTEVTILKGLKPLNEYKKLVKQAKKHFKETKQSNIEEAKEAKRNK